MKHSLILFALFAAGCQLATAPQRQDKDPSPSAPEHPPAAEVWIALAHAVEAKTLSTTTQLAQVVIALARNGDLSSSDVSEFDAIFVGIVQSDRALSLDDAQALRGLK